MIDIKRKNGFRKYYSWSLDDLIQDELKIISNEYLAIRHAKSRQRSYANLFNRDCRKTMLTAESKCASCESKANLEIDHIIPIVKGGKNEIVNVQILCFTCNNRKRGNNG